LLDFENSTIGVVTVERPSTWKVRLVAEFFYEEKIG
jgi:hypothetical protein